MSNLLSLKLDWSAPTVHQVRDAVQSDPMSTGNAERAEAGYVSGNLYVYNRSSEAKCLSVVHFVSTSSQSTFASIHTVIVTMPEVYAAHPEYAFPRNFKGFGEKGLEGLKWPNNAKIAVSFVINYEEVSLIFWTT